MANPGGGWDTLTGFRLALDNFVIFILTRWAVPCFLMISGFLLLDPQRQMGLRKALRYALRMAIVLITFGLFYCLIETAVGEGFSNPPRVFLVSLKNLLEGKSWAHMWYVYMLIGLYLLTPLLRVFVRGADSRTAWFTLAALFAFTILRPTLNALCKIELDAILPVTGSYLFYYLAGYYLGRARISRKTCAACLVIGIAGTLGMLALEMRGYLLVYANENAFIALYSMAVFALSANSRGMKRLAANPLLARISAYSFGIYLMHTFFLNLLNKGFDLFPDILPVGVGEMAFFVLALAGSYAATWILCRIKPVKRLLM